MYNAPPGRFNAPPGIELEFNQSCVSVGMLLALNNAEASASRTSLRPIRVKHSLGGTPHVLHHVNGRSANLSTSSKHRTASSYELQELSESVSLDNVAAANMSQSSLAPTQEEEDGECESLKRRCC